MTTQLTTEPFDYELPLINKDPEMGRRPISNPSSCYDDTEHRKFPQWIGYFGMLALGILIGYVISPGKPKKVMTMEAPTQVSNTKDLMAPTQEAPSSVHEPLPLSPVKIKSIVPEQPRPSEGNDLAWNDHIITPGETVHCLSCKYGVEIEKIYQHNGGKFVPKIGKVIQMPERQFPTHTVQKGETLYGIAANMSVPVQTLIQMNGIRGHHIKIDQVLRVR